MEKLYLKDKNELLKLIAIKGYTQKSFANAVDITPTYLSIVLNSKDTSIGKNTARKIARLLNIEIADIFFTSSVDKSYTDLQRQSI